MRSIPVVMGSLVVSLTLVALHAATPEGTALFRDVAQETGLTFEHDNGGRGDFYLPEIMGSGVALFDYDNDGDLDIYLVQGRPLDGRGAPAAAAAVAANAKSRGSRLFRNELINATGGRSSGSGNGREPRAGAGAALRFTDVTEAAGVGLDAVGMGAATGDIDNDGDLDLLVTAFGRNVLFRNNGNGTFTDITKTAGVDDRRWNTSAAFLDYDRDGDLDLFIASYVDFTVAANKLCADPVGARDYCSPKAYRPASARLFRNEGRDSGGGANAGSSGAGSDGAGGGSARFTDVSDAAGITRAYGNGLGVAVGDYNGDGWLDLYVANDATPNQLWINTQHGTFEDRGLLSGTAVNAEGNPEGSMGIASGDYDNDGDEDLFVTNLVGETHVLYVNDGRGNFEDARTRAALRTPTAAYTGFGTKWFDYDDDGRLDLFIANGAVNIVEALRGQPFPFRQINQLFRQGDGGRFIETTKDGGPALALSEVSRGAAFGDIDNDGDIDIVVANNNGPARLLLNEAGRPRGHWITIRAEQIAATASGGVVDRWAFGARVGIERRGQPTLWRRVGSDGSYLSASDPRVHIGLGASAQIDAVIIEWPDGRRERWTSIKADQLVTLKRGSGSSL
jgi:hypothetical protein